jgi:hypothetical protein
MRRLKVHEKIEVQELHLIAGRDMNHVCCKFEYDGSIFYCRLSNPCGSDCRNPHFF